MAAGRIPTTANSPLTTKGDLFSFSTAPARLAVGSNGDTIVADSSTATGLKYALPSTMTLLSTTTLTGATTTISSIPQTHKTLIAVITGVTNATANGRFRIDINGGATNNFYGGTYFQQGAGAAVYGAGFAYAIAGDADILRTSAANSFVFTLPNYNQTNIKSYSYFGAFVQAGGGQYSYVSAGYNNDATATTQLIFSNTGGNFSTGTVKLFGVN